MFLRGFNESILILCGVFGLIFVYGAYIGLKSLIFYDRPQVGLILLFSLVVGPLAATVSMFPIVFSTINLFYQNIFTLAFWRTELLSGVLPLRIVTYLLTFQLAVWLLRAVVRRKYLGELHRENGVSFQDAGNYFRIRHLKVATAWLSSDLASIFCIQLSFYLLSVSALWISRAENVDSIFFAASTWCVFFIVDDAKIIFEYCDHFRMPPLQQHNNKLMIFSAAIIFCVTALLVIANGWLVALPFFVTLASLATISQVLIFRLPRLIKKEESLRRKEAGTTTRTSV